MSLISNCSYFFVADFDDFAAPKSDLQSVTQTMNNNPGSVLLVVISENGREMKTVVLDIEINSAAWVLQTIYFILLEFH